MDNSQINTAGNTEEPETFSIQEENNAIPQLRYQDQTSIAKSTSKRSCAVLSPPDLASISESNANINEIIESSIEKVFEKQIPRIIEKLETTLSAFFKSLIGQGLQDVKETVLKEAKQTI